MPKKPPTLQDLMRPKNETASLVYPGIALLQILGCMAGRNNSGLAMGASGGRVKSGVWTGASDIFAICPGGRFLAAEAKLPGKKFTGTRHWPKQHAFLCGVNRIGGAAFVFTDLDQLKDWACAAMHGATFYVAADGTMRVNA